MRALNGATPELSSLWFLCRSTPGHGSIVLCDKTRIGKTDKHGILSLASNSLLTHGRFKYRLVNHTKATIRGCIHIWRPDRPKVLQPLNLVLSALASIALLWSWLLLLQERDDILLVWLCDDFVFLVSILQLLAHKLLNIAHALEYLLLHVRCLDFLDDFLNVMSLAFQTYPLLTLVLLLQLEVLIHLNRSRSFFLGALLSRFLWLNLSFDVSTLLSHFKMVQLFGKHQWLLD